MYITKELLKEHNACVDGYKFFVRNNLVGFPLYKLPLILNDNKYTRWFKTIIKTKYNDNAYIANDTTKIYKDRDMQVTLINGLISHYIDRNNEVSYVYDEYSRLIGYHTNKGFIATIHYEESNGVSKKTYRDTNSLEFTVVNEGTKLIEYINKKIKIRASYGDDYVELNTVYGSLPKGIEKINLPDEKLIIDNNRNVIYHMDSNMTEHNLVLLYDNGQLQQYNSMFIPKF